jgi:hypothetical protein
MADWNKIFAADWVNLAYQVHDQRLANALMMLMMHCLNQGGLPDDNEEIADITRVPVEDIQALRELRCVRRTIRIEGGKLYFEIVSTMIQEKAEFSRKQAERANKGRGKPEPAAESRSEPEPTTASHGEPRRATANHGQPIQACSHASNQAGMQAAPAPEDSPDYLAGDESSLPGDLTEFEQAIKAVTCEKSNNGTVNLRVKQAAKELAAEGFALAELHAFDAAQSKSPQLNFIVREMVAWRKDKARAPADGKGFKSQADHNSAAKGKFVH